MGRRRRQDPLRHRQGHACPARVRETVPGPPPTHRGCIRQGGPAYKGRRLYWFAMDRKPGEMNGDGFKSMRHMRAMAIDVGSALGGYSEVGNRRWFEPVMLCGFRISDHPASRSNVPGAGCEATARTLLRAVPLTCLIVSGGAPAQSTSAIAPASSGTSPRCAGAAMSDAVSANLDQFRCLTADEQAASLRTRIENHALLSQSDDQILALMDSMKPEAFVAYVRSNMVREDSCEYRMFRQERVLGRWPDRPDHMVIRYQDTPRKVYAKWLPDGGHAGQELLYDETTDRDSIFGHLGGSLRIVSGKIAIDGPHGRRQ